MKTVYFLGLLLAVSLTVVSCKKEPEKQSENALETSATAASDSIPKETIATDAPELNPPHGQPYHRCDIAVGTPLNTPVKPSSFYQQPVIPNATQTQSQTQPQLQTQPQSNPVATPTTPRPKFNPPHGQPHHDCKIQVGDPLPDA